MTDMIIVNIKIHNFIFLQTFTNLSDLQSVEVTRNCHLQFVFTNLIHLSSLAGQITLICNGETRLAKICYTNMTLPEWKGAWTSL